MLSNTKLDSFQKDMLKSMREFNPDVQFAHIGQTTFAYQICGNLVEFATAICSEHEKKNRKKVGKFHALERFENAQTVKVLHSDFGYMIEVLRNSYFEEPINYL